jgi:GTP-binding protein HflX
LSRAPATPPPPRPPGSTVRALVLCPVLRGAPAGARTPDARLAEAVGLARAIALDVAHAEVVRMSARRPATLLGRGTVDGFGEAIAAQEIGLAVIDAPLTPVQQRNLERAWKCKVIDRTGLILEIFGERARTREGQLQVELAALTYQRSRLVRSWTHLERQRGGFGFLGGPGESQLEMDRRLIGERIAKIKRDLLAVGRTRGLHRKARERMAYPVVALVGYTNAGKSTLFNRLTQAGVLAKDVAVRDARPDDARGAAAFGPHDHPLGHGRVHFRPADRPRRRLPRHPRRGARGRPRDPRARRGA